MILHHRVLVAVQACGRLMPTSVRSGKSVTAMLASPSLTVTIGQKPSAAGWVHVDVCLCMQAMLLQCLVQSFATNSAKCVYSTRANAGYVNILLLQSAAAMHTSSGML